MSGLWYLRSHVVTITCDALAVTLLATLLPALGVERDPTILVTTVIAILLFVPLLHGYLRERGLARQLADIANRTTDAIELTLLLEEPGWPEGDAAVDALKATARQGQRDAEDARAEAQQYRQYVESWVHEIKTPLAAIRLFLANHNDPSLRPLRLELDRVEGYVEQSLYYARSFSVERDYVIRRQSLLHVVQEAVRSRSGELIQAHVGVDLSGVGEDAAVPCDEKWMTFVIGQIVDNAVRYRSDPTRDGRTPRIEFTTRFEDEGTARERVVLDVRDNGCGISAADLGRVFERGFTGDNGRTHGHSTGMGLYLVRTLCEKMGLAVGIASEPGQGTCVSIAFPVM